MVCSSGGTIQHARYNDAEDQVRLRGRLTVARIHYEVRNLILHVPDNPYDTLKQQLIERTCLPEQRRLQQIFHSMELGEHKPMQLLRRMQQLQGDSAIATDGPLLRELFLQQLPSNIRMVLVVSVAGKSLEEMAEQADRIIDVAPPSVSTITTPTSKSPSVLSIQIYLTPEVNFPHDVMNAEITWKINLSPNELRLWKLAWTDFYNAAHACIIIMKEPWTGDIQDWIHEVIILTRLYGKPNVTKLKYT